MDAGADAERFAELFAALFHRFHRSDPVDEWQPSPETLALLEHLSRTGPVTIAEATRHFGRSQAATSELFARLEARGLLERRPDDRDRRRTLVWLSDTGLEVWRESRRVLSAERLAAAFARLEPEVRAKLLDATQALLDTNPETKEER